MFSFCNFVNRIFYILTKWYLFIYYGLIQTNERDRHGDKKNIYLPPPPRKFDYKLLVVLDQYDSENNGTTITASRLVNGLINLGCNVKVISAGKQEENKFTVRELKFPIVDKVVKSQGMMFAMPDEDVLYEGLK